MDVIGVLVRYEDRRYRRWVDTMLCQTLLSLFTRETTVDKDPLSRRFDEGTVCFAA